MRIKDPELWKDADEFVMGISAGRSWYYTNFFETPSVSVQLGIQADGGEHIVVEDYIRVEGPSLAV